MAMAYGFSNDEHLFYFICLTLAIQKQKKNLIFNINDL
jgi:hypothetical protein